MRNNHLFIVISVVIVMGNPLDKICFQNPPNKTLVFYENTLQFFSRVYDARKSYYTFCVFGFLRKGVSHFEGVPNTNTSDSLTKSVYCGCSGMFFVISVSIIIIPRHIAEFIWAAINSRLSNGNPVFEHSLVLRW